MNYIETNLKILTFAGDEPGGSDQHNTTESSTDYDHWTVILIKSLTHHNDQWC